MLQWRRWYTTGTVSVTNGSAVVTGSSTGWASQVKPGDVFTRDRARIYEVLTVDSNTQITLTETYAGTTASGQTYGIIRTSPAWNDTSDAAVKLAAYLEGVAGIPLTTKGDVLVYGANNSRLPVGTNGQILTADSAEALGVKWATNTAAPLTTKGDLFGFGTASARIPVGTNGHILTADSAEALGLKWAANPASSLTTKGDLLGFSTAAARLPVGTNGKILAADSAEALGLKWIDQFLASATTVTPTLTPGSGSWGSNPPSGSLTHYTLGKMRWHDLTVIFPSNYSSGSPTAGDSVNSTLPNAIAASVNYATGREQAVVASKLWGLASAGSSIGIYRDPDYAFVGGNSYNLNVQFWGLLT